MRFWYILHSRTTKAQVNLHKWADRQEPLLHTYKCSMDVVEDLDQNLEIKPCWLCQYRHLKLAFWAYVHLVPKSRELAHFYERQ